MSAARRPPADLPEATPPPDEQPIAEPVAEPIAEPVDQHIGTSDLPRPPTPADPRRESEHHSVHDAVPIPRTPTRKTPPDFRKRPQTPAPEHSAAPGSETVTRGPGPSATVATANASTEIPSEPRTEPSSHTPSEPRETPGTRPPSQLPTAPVPVVMPPGELPGPAVPSGSDESHGPGPGDGGSDEGDEGSGVRTDALRGRRRTGLAAAGVVAAGAVVWVVVAMTGGSPDGRTGASTGSSAPTASAATGAASSLSPTVEGTSRPPSLPPGAHREAGGYAWVTPKGWRRDLKTGSEVHYTAPDGAQELAAKSSLAKGNLMDTWQTSEQDARQGRDYRKIRLEETTFRGRTAIVWEYTFTLKGVSWHARLLGFDVDGKSYQINTWYHRDIEEQALKVYNQVKNSFTVL
ncbi:hypothetical protein [Streptomyces sp. NPDC002685]|uniref:hypothetical protein n=1 Tax=Streptomyces sp. NPDC002685 TaxID=3154540 RepID=UPI00332AE816